MRADVLFGAVALVAGASAIGPLRVRLNHRYDEHRPVLDAAEIPTPMAARAASLGHVEWLADVLWVNALLYYGDTINAHSPGRYVARYASAMTSLDPSFRQAYLWAGVAMTMRTTEVAVDEVRVATTFLREGVHRFPGDSEMHMQLGATLGFDLGLRFPRESRERREARAEAGEEFRRVVALGEGPDWLCLTAATLLQETGRNGAAIEVLRDGLVRAETPAMRDRVRDRLVELLRADSASDPGLAGVQAVEAARVAEYPYLPTPLYLFVGPRQTP